MPRTPRTLTVGAVADEVVRLADFSLALGRVDRTACYHPDGRMKESDSDHSLMLVFVACSLAARFFPHLDLGLIAQFAAVHDSPEARAGDTPTLRIDQAGRNAKAAREKAALGWMFGEFQTLDWLPRVTALYEEQELDEARYVRAVDKILPKAVHLLDRAAGLLEQGMGSDELTRVFAEQAKAMREYAGEFVELMQLREELVGRTLALLREVEPAAQAG